MTVPVSPHARCSPKSGWQIARELVQESRATPPTATTPAGSRRPLPPAGQDPAFLGRQPDRHPSALPADADLSGHVGVALDLLLHEGAHVGGVQEIDVHVYPVG